MGEETVSIYEMNIYEKLSKIAQMSGVKEKNKSGFNFKYTTEDEILASVTSGMKKYHVSLIPSIDRGTLKIEPYTYTKQKKNETITVNEHVISADMTYTWVNNDKPEEKIVVPWAMCSQKDDVSQAMGGAMTYANRYFLLKALQIATIDDDPDDYVSKQKQAVKDQEKSELDAINDESLKMINEKVALGQEMKDKLEKICVSYTPTKNPKAIKNIELAKKLNQEIKDLK